jgi:hypothetical protein
MKYSPIGANPASASKWDAMMFWGALCFLQTFEKDAAVRLKICCNLQNSYSIWIDERSL